MRLLQLQLIAMFTVLATASPAQSAAPPCQPPGAAAQWQPAPYPPGRRVLQVGPGRTYETLAAVAKAAKDGDVIEIDAGEYQESVLFKAGDLWLRGVGGRPHLRAPDKLFGDKGILVFRNGGIVIENLEFSGAHARARNGAGVRNNRGDLTIRHSLFRDSDNGLLVSHDPEAVVLIEHSEFSGNGLGDGLTHNLYVGRVKRLELRHSYSHDVDEGHLVKTRAAENLIEYNRLVDDTGGKSSYEIDVTFPGETRIVGNLIVQSATSPNQSIVSYAAGKEKATAPTGRLTVAFNTIYNHRRNPVFVNNNSTGTALVINNVFGGSRGKEDIRGPAEARGNVTLGADGFVAADRNDFRLSAGSAAIDAAVAGVDPPGWEPVSGPGSLRRASDVRTDAGAHEFCRSP